MKTILFDIAPYQGHYNPVLGLAKLLKSIGYKVVFLGDPKFANLILNEGFYFVSFSIANEINVYNPKFRITEIIGLSEYMHWHNYIEKYIKIVADQNPDLVVLDDDTDNKLLWYNAHNINTVTVSSKPYNGPDKSIPPYNISFGPSTNIITSAYINFLWRVANLKNWFRYVSMNIATLKYNENNFSYNYFKNVTGYNAPPPTFKNAFKWTYYSNDVKLILVPQAFEFPRKYPQNIAHLNFYGLSNRNSVVKDPRYISLIEKIEAYRLLFKPPRFIYCSLGTLTNMYKKDVEHFFSCLIDAAAALPSVELIISLGDTMDTTFIKNVPNNIYIFKSVPQWHLLRYVDAMINHGGMNTVLECINNTVPQIVYPLSNGWEQNGNAQKVLYHKLGLIGNLRTATTKKIIKNINDLFVDIVGYKENINSMSEKIASSANHEEISEIIGRLLHKSANGN